MNTRRAFALPLVVILAAVLATVVAYMLARQSVQALTVERQINRYREHHAGRGMAELVDGFLKTVRNHDPSTAMTPDGKVLDCDLPGGGTLSVFMADGQSDPVDPTIAGSDRDSALALSQATPEGTAGRTMGPTQVSINSASQETLIAIAKLCTADQHGEDFALAVLSARAGKPIPPEDINKIAQSVGFTPEQLTVLSKYLTAEPQIWLVETHLRPGGGPAFLGSQGERVFTAKANLGGHTRTAAITGINQVWSRRSALHEWKEIQDPKLRQFPGGQASDR